MYFSGLNISSLLYRFASSLIKLSFSLFFFKHIDFDPFFSKNIAAVQRTASITGIQSIVWMFNQTF